jgi:hypothetical protein
VRGAARDSFGEAHGWEVVRSSIAGAHKREVAYWGGARVGGGLVTGHMREVAHRRCLTQSVVGPLGSGDGPLIHHHM